MLIVQICNSFITFSDNVGDQLKESTKKKLFHYFIPLILIYLKLRLRQNAKKDLGLR